MPRVERIEVARAYIAGVYRMSRADPILATRRRSCRVKRRDIYIPEPECNYFRVRSSVGGGEQVDVNRQSLLPPVTAR